MATLQLQKWNGGLDTRRSELTSQQNVLETAQDVQINQGSEVEKRKVFAEISAFSVNVFGLETGLTLYAFGSAAVGAVTVPAGVTYIQCAHPTDTTKAMTAILCSCDFGGQAFCVAQFGTEVYWFLNGVIIGPSIAGQVLTIAGANPTTAQVVAQMYSLLSGTSWSDAGIHVENLTKVGFNIYTDFGVTWSPTITISNQPTSTGTITTALVDNGNATVDASNGAAQLTLYAGSAGSITVLSDSLLISGTRYTTYQFLSAAIPWNSSIHQTLLDLATAAGTKVPATLAALSVAPATLSVATNVINIGTTNTNLAANYLTVTVDKTTACDLCFDNMFFDCSNVTTLQTLHNIWVTNGVNLANGLSYKNGRIAGSPAGTNNSGYTNLVLPYGTYLWIPGKNDLWVGDVSGVHYLATDWPQGIVLTYSSGDFSMAGTSSNIAATVQLFALTDILASSVGLPLGGTLTTVATQLAAIATAINAHGSAYVASNKAAVLPASGYNTNLYISRRNVVVNSSSYSNIYYYIGSTAIAGISPASITPITTPTQFGISVATAGLTGRGPTYSVVFSGTWIAGDTYTFDIVTPSVTYTAGTGLITQLAASACLTLSNRVHVVSGSYWNGCDTGDATQWEQQAAGAFQIDVSQYFQQADTLISLAAYQGRIALFASYVTLIWSLDANPANITLTQAMANIGTFCALGPQSLGDLDVIFPSITGFRSLRVRDLTLNAYVNDLGSPVDLLVQNDINSLGLQNLVATCAIVEPSANRYWCYLNGKIYVLSYFPSAKILGWSIFTPTFTGAAVNPTTGTYQPSVGGPQVEYIIITGQQYLWVKGVNDVSIGADSQLQTQTGFFTATNNTIIAHGVLNGAAVTAGLYPVTTFTPIKFVIFKSQVYLLASVAGTNYLFVYGGANNITYDNTLAITAPPWLDFGAPGVRKRVSSLDFAMTGGWQFFLSMDYYGYVNNGAALAPVTLAPVTNPSYQLGSYAIARDGFHLKLQAICATAAYSLLSALDVHYEKLNEK